MLVPVLRTLRPSLPGVLGLVLACAAGLLGAGFVGFMFDALADWSVVAFSVALFIITPFGIGLVFAGLVAGRPAPRAWIFGMAFVSILVGTFVCALAFLAGLSLVDVAMIVVLFFGPPLLMTGGPALGYAVGGIAEVRDAVNAWRRRGAVEAAGSAGRARISELADQLGLDFDEVVEALADALDAGELDGRLEPEHGWYWSTPTLREGLDTLAEQVATRGQVGLDELGRSCDVPIEVIRRWVYEGAHRGLLTGYVNWKTGTVFSADASALRAGRECPVCGGELELTGRRSARCRHCGSDVLLGQV